MLTRRKFLGEIALSTAALSLPGVFSACTVAGNRKLAKLGFISGIIGKELEGNWKDVLMKTAGMGYSEIETGRYLGESAPEFLAFCRRIGLKPIAGGTRLYENKDELSKSLDSLNDLELKYAVIYWPWLTGAPFSLEDCKKSADLLNIAGEICKARDIQLCWHNHDNEFFEMGEGTPFDYLMNNTDKDLVKCEMDVYWVKKGGADPVEILQKYPGRYPILHLKDMAPGEEKDFECVGSGIIDFPSILHEAADQKIDHYFVERDKVQDGMACLESAAAYLKELRF